MIAPRWLARLVILSVSLAGATTAIADLSILDPAGDPVTGARVEMRLAPATSDLLAQLAVPVREGTSGPGGRVALDLPAVSLLLAVDHPAFAPWVQEIDPTGRGPVIQLSSGRSVTGAVRAKEGKVREGAVCASWEETREPGGFLRRWERCAELDDEGRFRLTGLADVAVDLVVRARGFLPLRERLVVRPATPPLELKLIPGVLLSGRLVSAGGSAISEGRVEALQTDSVAEVATDGTFELPVESLPVSLAARAPGYRGERVSVSEPPTSDRPLLVELRASERLIGVVLGDEGEAPEGAELVWELREEGRRMTDGYAIRSGDGAFQLDLPGAGEYLLRARAVEYRDELLPAVTVASGETIDLGVVTLSRGAGVRGTLVDADTGDPLAGVAIQLLPGGTELFWAIDGDLSDAVSDSEGRFDLFGLEGGRYELRARRAGYAVHAEEVEVRRDAVTELDPIALGRGTTIKGRLVDRAGEPRSGLAVRFFDRDHSVLVPVAERVSDALGAFTGPALGAGRFRVEVTGDRLLLAQEIEVPQGEEELDVEMVVGGVELSGVVRRGTELLPGGTIILSSALDPGNVRGKLVLHAPRQGRSVAFGLPETSVSAPVAADGSFRFENAPAGLLWATYVGLDGASVHRELLVPDLPRAEVAIDFAGVDLSGRVVDASGVALPAASLRVLDPTGRAVGEAQSDVEGRFVVGDLAPGSYHLEAAAEGYLTRTLRAIPVGEGAAPLEVVLEPGENGRLDVLLSRFDGSPVAGSILSLLDRSGQAVRSLLTDARGFRNFEGLPGGEYFVVWSDPVAGAGHSPGIRVGGPEGARWEGVLPPGGPLRLVCLLEGCAGAGVELLTVHAANGLPLGPFLSGMSAGLRFSDGGDLTLGRLSPGDYLVTLWVAGRRLELPVRMASGQETLVAVH